MLLRLTIGYAGSAFRGFARQPGERTVEGELTTALQSIYTAVGPPAVAGRTDAGVHALANVVSVEVSGGPPPERAARALNAVLPADLAVSAACEAPEGFHARFSARSRSYRYRLWRSENRSPFEADRALWYPGRLEREALEECAAMLRGEHDFRAFTPTDSQHDVFVRQVLDASWHERGEALEFEITADSFLRHMVRTLVGTMIACSPQEFEALLRGAHRAEAGATLPPWGLFLVEVAYCSPPGVEPRMPPLTALADEG